MEKETFIARMKKLLDDNKGDDLREIKELLEEYDTGNN